MTREKNTDSPPELLISIERFWTWFLLNESELRRRYNDPLLIAELELHLSSPGILNWEIGPAQDDVLYFAVSPRLGTSDPYYQTAVTLIQRAPRLEKWQFRLFKPARDWQLEFEIQTSQGRRIIDANRWEFVLYEFEDGSFDVLFKPDATCAELTENELRDAATIVVDGELGEEMRRELVGAIEVVDSWKPAEARQAATLEPGVLRRLVTNRQRS